MFALYLKVKVKMIIILLTFLITYGNGRMETISMAVIAINYDDMKQNDFMNKERYESLLKEDNFVYAPCMDIKKLRSEVENNRKLREMIRTY